MATVSVGTTTNSILTGVVWHSNIAQADVRAINALILKDLETRRPVADLDGSGGFVREGVLYVPSRGPLQLYDGDVVAVDRSKGGVILITALAAADAGIWTIA